MASLLIALHDAPADASGTKGAVNSTYELCATESPDGYTLALRGVVVWRGVEFASLCAQVLGYNVRILAGWASLPDD